MSKPVIAIDGPAASGKGTLARTLASKLNYAYMDTGALYRAVAWEVLQAGTSPENEADALTAAENLKAKILAADDLSSILGHEDLRREETGTAAGQVASIPAVRDALFSIQKDFAKTPPRANQGAVLDGRDIGTVICPEADVKLFVTADIETRAKRRLKELQSKGKPATYGAVLKDMRERDARDKAREAAPLKPADNAVTLDTSELSPEEVMNRALEIIREKLL